MSFVIMHDIIMRFFSWFIYIFFHLFFISLFVCYVFFVPINQFMLDKIFRAGCEEEGRGGKKDFHSLYFFVIISKWTSWRCEREKDFNYSHIYIFTCMLVWYVIRHMNIYIVITRINSELNCLIIMHLSCCLIFVFLMMVLHSF